MTNVAVVRLARVACVFLAVGGVGSVNAAEKAMPAVIKACAAEKDDARRLACFDHAVANAPAATTADAAAASAAPPLPVLSPEEEFGMRGELEEEKAPRLKELEAVVTEIGSKPHGELIITLDNGQLWAEITPSSNIRLKVGDRIKIANGALGSYRMSANGRSAPVTRLR